jgi:hypothetical protein
MGIIFVVRLLGLCRMDLLHLAVDTDLVLGYTNA